MSIYSKILKICVDHNQNLVTNQHEYNNRYQLVDITCYCGVTYKINYRNLLNGIIHCTDRYKEYELYKLNRTKTKETILCANKECNKEFIHKNNKKYCSIICSVLIQKTEEYSNSITIVKIKNNTKLYPIICKVCNIEFKPKRFDIILCSRKCSQEYSRRDEYKEIAQRNGSAGGKISATVQGRRSKNEIYFAEKCEEYFGIENVTTNEACFEGFDCDIIIHKEKLAISYNGSWHYKQISKTQSLKQVQARDKVKEAIVTKYGYRFYVVKDMGKHDKNFVNQEFEIMLLFLMSY